jgi:hypothetical protein
MWTSLGLLCFPLAGGRGQGGKQRGSCVSHSLYTTVVFGSDVRTPQIEKWRSPLSRKDYATLATRPRGRGQRRSHMTIASVR